MAISKRVGRRLRKGETIEIDGKIFLPVVHQVNKHQKEAIDKNGLTKLKVGDVVLCYLDGLLEIRAIRRIEQVNYLPRFKVGTPDDLKKWIGKTKIFGIEESPCEELEIELE
jgi:hypothetical protein